MFKKAKKGFTIVELVIVIAVIGILSAILIPTFANLTTQANQTALRSNLANAYSLYASEAADQETTKVTTVSSSKVESKVDIVFVSQEKVFLVKEDGSDGAKGYVFNGKEWAIDPVDYALEGTKTLVADDADVKLSTFGGFVVYYGKVTA